MFLLFSWESCVCLQYLLIGSLIVLRLLVWFHACCGCSPWKNSPHVVAAYPRKILHCVAPTQGVPPLSLYGLVAGCFEGGCRRSLAGCWLMEKSLFSFELELAVHVSWILSFSWRMSWNTSAFFPLLLSLEVGDRPPPSEGFPMALWYSGLTEVLAVSAPDVGFVFWWSFPCKSGWRDLNCFHMALLTGKPFPYLGMVLDIHL